MMTVRTAYLSGRIRILLSSQICFAWSALIIDTSKSRLIAESAFSWLIRHFKRLSFASWGDGQGQDQQRAILLCASWDSLRDLFVGGRVFRTRALLFASSAILEGWPWTNRSSFLLHLEIFLMFLLRRSSLVVNWNRVRRSDMVAPFSISSRNPSSFLKKHGEQVCHHLTSSASVLM